MDNIVFPLIQLCLRRQFAVDYQVCNFKVRALFRELFDGISSVPQNTLIAVYKRNSAPA